MKFENTAPKISMHAYGENHIRKMIQTNCSLGNFGVVGMGKLRRGNMQGFTRPVSGVITLYKLPSLV